jgi:7,8-dihydropterin-6-yl-methyl-4-(beta-D-ribofuranosyl)aminobenzene 5'-phosphate synthase
MLFGHAHDLLNRRDIVCGGGAVGFGTLVAGLIGGSKPVRAEGVKGAVPEIDRLAIRIVVDNYQFAVAPSRKSDSLDIQHFGWGITADSPPSHTLVSEFGLSMHVESQSGAETRHVLVDFGFTPEALVNNLALLGVDPSALDALIISHGHYDHFGGLAGFLLKHKAALKSQLPIFVGGEECFCAREWTAPPVRGNFGAIDRQALSDANLAVTYAEGPSLVANHGFTTGQIDLVSFEKLLSPSAMKIGFAGGFGCYAEKFSDEERTKAIIPDQFRHEIATAFHLKGRGLVVLTSCSHRGVINAINQAQSVSGVSKVHAVVGGFHLAPHKEDYVRETVLSLREINPDYVVPLHCTGEPFFEMAKAEIPAKLVRAYTGTRLVFA